MPRTIVHLDLDAFFCAVEEQRDPSLAGRAFAVGGRPGSRGVVSTCSYAARQFGVRSAMPMAQAVRLCPQLLVLPPRFPAYSAASHQVMARLHALTPLVEQLSIDEAFLDVSALPEPGEAVARRLQAAIREELGLPCSLGVATNKLVAKIATDVGKVARRTGGSPNALQVVPPGEEAAFLAPLPAGALWGVGPKTAARLAKIGVTRAVDLLSCDPATLARVVGSFAPSLLAQARGIDERPVVPDRPSKSVGNETTFANDVLDLDVLRAEAEGMARRDASWLAKHDLVARTVVLKLRYAGFQTVTRSESRDPATREAGELAARAAALLLRTEAGRRPVRLIGVSLHGLEEGPGADAQLPLL
jgi:DNA polymerase-4